MFKDRAIQVRMVKSKPEGDAPTETTVQILDPEVINQIAKEQVQNVAIAVGAVITATKLLNTVQKIAIIAAKAKIH